MTFYVEDFLSKNFPRDILFLLRRAAFLRMMPPLFDCSPDYSLLAYEHLRLFISFLQVVLLEKIRCRIPQLLVWFKVSRSLRCRSLLLS